MAEKKYTPMMQHYLQTKEEYKDAALLKNERRKSGFDFILSFRRFL